MKYEKERHTYILHAINRENVVLKTGSGAGKFGKKKRLELFSQTHDKYVILSYGPKTSDLILFSETQERSFNGGSTFRNAFAQVLASGPSGVSIRASLARGADVS